MDFLIASRRQRPGDDPIFSLNAEARARRDAGEAVVNATIGALLDDDGQLVLMPSVVRVFADVDREPARVVTTYRTSKISKYWRD